MSGRRRRSESLWDTKEETMPQAEIDGKVPWRGKELHSSFRGGSSPKWSNSEVNDALMSDDFPGQPPWDPLQGDGNVRKDDEISRDRRRMQTDTAFEEWEGQYGTRPSDDSYGLPYRVRDRDRGIVGSGSMSRGRDRSRSRSWSPKRSRSRSRSRGRADTRGMARSRSRSRGRDRGRTWESARPRSRSPFSDDRRESYEYAEVRNDSRVSSRPCKDFLAGNCRRGSQCRFYHQEILHPRGGSRQDSDLTDRWSSRSEYSGGSRYGDNRNSADHPRNRGSDGYRKDGGLDEEMGDAIKDAHLCKDFMKGRCHRGGSCRFPHHVASGENYHRGDRNFDDPDRRRQSNRSSRIPCKFFAIGKCNRDDCKFSHDALESGGYGGRLHDNIRGPSLGEKNRTWDDRQPRDDLKADFAKPSRGNDKNKSWNGPTWADVESDDNNKSWNGPTWADVESERFDGSSRDNLQRHTLDDMNKQLDGPSWDGVNASAFPDLSKPSHNSDDKKSWNGTSRDKSSASVFCDAPKSNRAMDSKQSSWNGPSQDEVSPSGYSGAAKSSERDGSTVGMLQMDSKSRKWDGPRWNEKAPEKNDYLLSQEMSLTNDTNIASTESRGANNQEIQLISDDSPSHTLDAQAQHAEPEASGYQHANATTAMRAEMHGSSYIQQHQRWRENDDVMIIDDSDAHNRDLVSENADQQVCSYGKDITKTSMGCEAPNLNETEQSHHMSSLGSSNGPKIQLNRPVQGMFLRLDSQKQMQIQNKGGQPLEALEIDTPQVMHDMNATVASSEQAPQVSSLPLLPQISQKGQPPQTYSGLNLTNAIELLYSLPSSVSSSLPIDPMGVQHNADTRSKQQYEPARDTEASKPVETSVPTGILSSSVGQEAQIRMERFSPISTGDPNSINLGAIGVLKEEHGRSPKTKKQELVGKPEGDKKREAENPKHEPENINAGKSEAQGKIEEGNISNDEKAMRQFKIALVEFVKEILKPTWKEGKMSREVHKTVVKKVVDKVTSTIQGPQIPRTQERIDQYLAYSKPKISKLVEAYVERHLKGLANA